MAGVTSSILVTTTTYRITPTFVLCPFRRPGREFQAQITLLQEHGEDGLSAPCVLCGLIAQHGRSLLAGVEVVG